MKKLFISAFIALCSLSLAAQRRAALQLFYAPGISDIHVSNSSLRYESDLFHSFGMRLQYDLNNRIFLQTGLGILHQGALLPEIEEVTVQQPEGTGRFFNFRYHTQALVVPLGIGYDLAGSERMRIAPDVNVLNGLFLRQTVELLNGDAGTEEPSEVEDASKYYLALEGGVSFSIELKRHLSLGFRPNIRYQLNLVSDREVIESHLVNYALDIAVGYIF